MPATDLAAVPADPVEAPVVEKKPEYVFKAKITEIAQKDPDKLKKELHITVEYYSEVAEARWIGTFAFVRSRLGTYGQAKVIEAQLNQGTIPTGNAYWLHQFVSHIEAHAISTPAWWKPLHREEGFFPEDFKLVEDVYQYVTRWEGYFRRPSVV